MGTSFEESYVKNIQEDIRLACKTLEELGYDSLVIMASKDNHVGMGSEIGVEFIHNHTDLIEEFIQFCRVKIKPENQLLGLTLKVKVPAIKVEESSDQKVLLYKERAPSNDSGMGLRDTNETSNLVTRAETEDMMKWNSNAEDVDVEPNLEDLNTDPTSEDLDYVPNAESLYPGAYLEAANENRNNEGLDSEHNSEDLNMSGDEDDDYEAGLGSSELDNEKDMDITQDIEDGESVSPKNKTIAEKKENTKTHKTSPVRNSATARKSLKQHAGAAKLEKPKKRYACDKCEKKYRSNKDLTIHKRIHTGDAPFVCNVCTRAFRSGSLLKAHMSCHSTEKRFSCNICGALFRRQNSVYRHKSATHSLNKSKEGGGKNWVVKQQLPIKTFDCDQCDKKYRANKDLTIHKRIHSGETPFVCQTCSKGFRSGSLLRAHMQTHGDKKHTCEFCGRLFLRRTSLLSHKKLVHYEKILIDGGVEESVAKQLVCTSRKTYECDECDKKYLSNKDLTIHKRLHTGDAPFVCQTCGKAFRASGLLKSHSVVHIKELSHSCKECGAAFPWRGSLRRHIANVHCDVARFICDMCGRGFKDQSALRRHRLRHIGEKRHSCETCGKSFLFPYALKEHRRIHTGVKPFVCDVCSQRFSAKHTLVSHQDRKHPGHQMAQESEHKPFMLHVTMSQVSEAE